MSSRATLRRAPASQFRRDPSHQILTLLLEKFPCFRAGSSCVAPQRRHRLAIVVSLQTPIYRSGGKHIGRVYRVRFKRGKARECTTVPVCGDLLRRVYFRGGETERLIKTACSVGVIHGSVGLIHGRDLGIAHRKIGAAPRHVIDCADRKAGNCCRCGDPRPHITPLVRRVALRYSPGRAVSPARGIGLPYSVGAARAKHPL